MEYSRRTFLKVAGAAGIVVTAGRSLVQAAEQPAQSMGAAVGGELPKQMTFCTLRRDGRAVLGIRTAKGVLDVEKAAKILGRSAPATINEVLQGADPQVLKS